MIAVAYSGPTGERGASVTVLGAVHSGEGVGPRGPPPFIFRGPPCFWEIGRESVPHSNLGRFSDPIFYVITGLSTNNLDFF